MPPISTHMHFGKIFIENSDDEIDIRSFILGIVSPDIFNDEDTFEEFHCLDEDGNIDVREFYEKFNLKEIESDQKSFILGYYCHLWFDEYYKFNASKLTVHNNLNLSDGELCEAVKNTLKYYDYMAVGSFYEKLGNIDEYNLDLKLEELKNINLEKSKDKIINFFKDTIPSNIYTHLIEEKEYINFIKKGYFKIVKSL